MRRVFLCFDFKAVSAFFPCQEDSDEGGYEYDGGEPYEQPQDRLAPCSLTLGELCMDALQFFAEGLEVVGGEFDGCHAEQRADGDSSAPDSAIRRPASGTDIPSCDRPSDFRMILMFSLSIGMGSFLSGAGLIVRQNRPLPQATGNNIAQE